MRTDTLDGTTLEKLISAAVAAPACHSRRPWRYRLDPDTATLHVRGVGAEDRPPGAAGEDARRAVHVSVGAALFNLRVAVSHFGWEPQVRLLPSPDDPGLYATVRLTAPARAPETSRDDLYGALWWRRDGTPSCPVHRPPGAVVLGLVDAAHTEGAALSLPHAAETRRLLRLTEDAHRRDPADAVAVRWPPAGEPPSALGPAPGDGRFPLVAVLTTPLDDPADWLRAGQALEHVLLAATARRVRAALLYQALDYPDLRRALRSAESGPGHVQMLVRLGYGPLRPGTAPRGPGHTMAAVN
ncbi:hypothetical protein ABZ883_41305 [Streptomyces sp. NPDC046977]|uniref:hypothetical protein n=1 Tax=Streptomyces sp. NPDC046977 TaxID=3154703 RepID=UPI0033E86DB5